MVQTTLYSHEFSGKCVLIYIQEILKIKDSSLLSGVGRNFYNIEDYNGNIIFDFDFIPKNGIYNLDDLEIEILDYNVDNKQLIIRIDRYPYVILSKKLIIKCKTDTYDKIIEFITKANLYIDKKKDNNKKIKKKDKIIKYNINNKCCDWDINKQSPKRYKETIFLKKNQFENIYDKLNDFIKPDIRETYVKYGIPYKLNILLSGKPGVGKTSLIHCLASHFDANLYILNINSELTEDTFNKCINNMNTNKDGLNFLIMEDIDCIFDDRKKHDVQKNHLTLHGLLNVMDGFDNPEGAIIILTTNYPEKLDRALVRDGRIDYKLDLTYLDKYQTYNMYKSYFNDENDNIFNKIWDKIKGLDIAPSTLNLFLFNNRLDTNIYDKIDDFIISIEEKERSSLYL